jgi:pimeloyl-ACP methyl ester carboxylesterase
MFIMPLHTFQTLPLNDHEYLAYQHLPGKSPGVLFFGGYQSDMTGSKAHFLAEHCAHHGQAFTRFDYFGHGQSSGTFAQGTLSRWKADALTILDRITSGPQILVGSSMGGWLMILAALERPERIVSLIGIAAAPDFVNRLLTEEQKQHIGAHFIADAQPLHLLNREGRLPIHCPIHLFHGLQDTVVPWHFSMDLAERCASQDISLTLIKNGDHRLSTPDNLEQLGQRVLTMFHQYR